MHVYIRTMFISLLVSSIAFAQVCPISKYWVDGFPRTDYIRKDGTYYSASQVTGHCRSRSATYTFWIEKLVNGNISGWPHKSEVFKGWSQKEIEAVLDALEKVPKFLWQDVKIFRASKSSEHHKNLATSAANVMVIYDTFFADKSLLPRVLAHELAHELYRDMIDIDMTEYWLVAQWNQVRTSIFTTTRKRFVAQMETLVQMKISLTIWNSSFLKRVSCEENLR